MKKFKLNKQPKVLHVCTALSWRGGEQQAAYLVEELKDKVCSVVLCSKGSEMESYCNKNNIDYYSQAKRGGIDLAYARSVKLLCKKLEIDLCHVHDAHAHTFAILAAVLFRNKTPIILSRRVDFPIRNSFFSKYKYNHNSIAKILCVSETIKEVTANGIRDERKLCTVYSGIDLNKFKARTNKLRNEYNISAGTKLIGNTSAIADHKDYYTFVEVAKVIISRDKSCRFFIIGDGPMRKEIEDYVAENGLTKVICFTGFRTDIVDIIADLDVFLITSKTEGLGTSILDAFAAKVPVVATAAGGIPELVENDVTGKLCAVRSIDCLAEGVMEIIENKEKSAILIESAFQKVQLFSKSVTAQKTYQQYLEVLA